MRKITQIQFTKEGLEEIKNTYEALLSKRSQAVKNLSEARNLGDLSENGLYKAARAQLSSIDANLRRLKNTIKLAFVEEIREKNTVCIGIKVTVLGDKREKTYKIVGPFEADPSKNKISINSPIGRSLINKKINDVVEVYTPSGKTTLKIINIF